MEKRELPARHLVYIYAVVVSLTALVSFELLYRFRSFDDNRLTSWEYAFAGADFWNVFFLMAAGILCAYVLSRFSLPERHRSLFLFAVAYAVSAVFWRQPEVIVDASRYFIQAKHLEVYGIGYFFREWGRTIAAWTDLPVLPFLYGMIFRFGGESRLLIQVFSSFLFSATVVLTYLTGKRLWNEDTGFYGGMLLLGIPYLYSQVPLMLVDVPSMCFLMLSVYLFIAALDRGRMMVPVAAVAIFLTFYSKYSTWLMMSILAVIFLIRVIHGPASERRGFVLRALAVGVFACLMIGALILFKFEVFSTQMKLLLSYQKPGLERWGESFISTFFFQIHPFITIAALYSVIEAFRKKDLKYLVVLWLPALIFFLQIKRIRYSIMMFPMFSLMAAFGLAQFRSRETAKFIVHCTAACSIVVAVFAYLPYLEKISTVNLKEAGAFVNMLEDDVVEVFTPATSTPVLNPAVSVPIFDLYTHKKIRYEYRPAFFPDPETVRTAPLRFTWEYRNPSFYASAYASAGQDKKRVPVVVIDNEQSGVLPGEIIQKTEGFERSRVFKTSEGIFGYQTLVTVYY